MPRYLIMQGFESNGRITHSSTRLFHYLYVVEIVSLLGFRVRLKSVGLGFVCLCLCGVSKVILFITACHFRDCRLYRRCRRRRRSRRSSL